MATETDANTVETVPGDHADFLQSKQTNFYQILNSCVLLHNGDKVMLQRDLHALYYSD